MHRSREFTPDRFTRTLLASIAALLAVIALQLWAGLPGGRAAVAQIPDAGRQRFDQIAEARRTNELLSEIAEHLKKGTLKVEWASADKQRAAEPSRAAKRGP